MDPRFVEFYRPLNDDDYEVENDLVVEFFERAYRSPAQYMDFEVHIPLTAPKGWNIRPSVETIIVQNVKLPDGWDDFDMEMSWIHAIRYHLEYYEHIQAHYERNQSRRSQPVSWECIEDDIWYKYFYTDYDDRDEYLHPCNYCDWPKGAWECFGCHRAETDADIILRLANEGIHIDRYEDDPTFDEVDEYSEPYRPTAVWHARTRALVDAYA